MKKERGNQEIYFLAQQLTELHGSTHVTVYFLTGRDITWTPRNKRPERLRENLKETEVKNDFSICIFKIFYVDDILIYRQRKNINLYMYLSGAVPLGNKLTLQEKR